MNAIYTRLNTSFVIEPPQWTGRKWSPDDIVGKYNYAETDGEVEGREDEWQRESVENENENENEVDGLDLIASMNDAEEREKEQALAESCRYFQEVKSIAEAKGVWKQQQDWWRDDCTVDAGEHGRSNTAEDWAGPDDDTVVDEFSCSIRDAYTVIINGKIELYTRYPTPSCSLRPLPLPSSLPVYADPDDMSVLSVDEWVNQFLEEEGEGEENAQINDGYEYDEFDV